MSSLYIDFSYDDNVKNSIKKAKRAISSRITDYDGIIRRVDNIGSNTGNLSTANSYIRRKRNKLQDKHDRLENFRKKIDEFNDMASDTDKNVAKRIKKETKDFYKRENIPHGFFYAVGCVVSDGWKWIKGKAEKIWDTICKTAKSAWETIKEFYEKNKYIINLVVDVVILVAAIGAAIATGGAGIAFAVALWGVAKATADVVFDTAAAVAHYTGDEDQAEEWADSNLKTVFKFYGGDFGGMLYDGIEIATAVYDISKFGSGVKDAYKTYKAANGKFGLDKAKMIKTTIQNGIGIKYGGDNKAANIFGNLKWGATAVQTWLSDKDVGTKVAKTFKLSNAGYKIINNGKSYATTYYEIKIKPVLDIGAKIFEKVQVNLPAFA